MEGQKLLRFLKKNRNNVKLILLFSIIFFCTLLYAFCSQKSDEMPRSDIEDVEYEHLKITAEDMRIEPQDEKYIDLSTKNENLIINEPGDYVVVGKFDHTIYIDVEEKIVHLYLNNVTIDAIEGAAIHVLSAAKVIITMMPDSVNYIMDAPARIENAGEKATIMSDADITINGNGELILYGYYGDGIRTKDVLKILDADVKLQSKGDGIRGNDGVLLNSDSIQIESEKNGVYTSDVGKAGKGTVKIENGNVSVIAGEYGILSRGDLILDDCSVVGKGARGLYYTEGECSIGEGCINNG